MIYKKLIAVFILVLIICSKPMAQNGSYELRNVIPASATVASLGKYGETPVSPYTGIPNISIPLYEIKDGPLSFPISLSYHAGGIRVEEIASAVGLGWTLNATGIIQRRQRGLMDEMGWVLTDPTQRIDYILQNGTMAQKQTMWLSLDEGTKDGEADIFSYDLNGPSGKYYFDQAGNAYNYPAKNVKITPIGGWSPGINWMITTEDGTIYEFTKSENVTSIRGSTDQEATTAWYLTKIKSSDGKREINFTYETVYYSTYTFLGQTIYIDLPGSEGGCLSGNETWGSNSYVTQRLTRIDFSNGYVKFNYSGTERQDLPGEKSLNQIEVYSNPDNLIKRYDLDYAYFGSGGTDPNDKRLKLTSLTEKTPSSQKPPYLFTYEESIPMPNRNSLSRDHWGFYNGASNNTAIPSFDYYINGVLHTYPGADRNANQATVQACILQKIKYPTGGETIFTYECNTTTDSRIPAVAGVRYVGGLRIKQIEDKPGDIGKSVIKKFRYDIGGMLVNFPTYGYELQVNKREPGIDGCNNGITTNCSYLVRQSFTNYPLATTQGGTVGYCCVTEDMGDNGEIQHQYNVSGNVDQPFPFPPVETAEWQRGAETSTKYYAKKNGSLVITKEIGYAYLALDKGTVNSYKVGRNSIFIGSCAQPTTTLPVSAQYTVATQFYTVQKVTNRVYDQNDITKFVETTTDYTYDPNHFQATSVLTSATSADATIKDEIVVNKKYPQDYSFSNPSGSEALGIKELQDQHIVNVPVEEYTYRQKRNISNNQLSDQKVISSVISTFLPYYGYPNEIFKLETSTPIALSSFGSGSGVSSNSFIKNTNSSIANSYKPAIQFTNYDNAGNLISQRKANDIEHVYIWGYNKKYPVADVVGISQTQAMSVLDQSILDNPPGDAGLRTELNKIRTNFPSAQVTSYTYIPLIGTSSQTDINGRTTYYSYDELNRLILIKDNDGNILQKYCYNYFGQPGTCTLYGNAVKTGTYTKQCLIGTGTQVTYTVPVNTYYASTQQEADALAQNDVNSNGQGYANANGTCTAPQATIYLANATTDTYYLSFTNTVTSQTYYITLDPFSSPTLTLPEGTYTVTVTSSPNANATYINVVNYSTYGTSANFQNVSITGSSNFVNIGD